MTSDRPAQESSAEEIKITPEMIEAAATVLLHNPFCDITMGIAEDMAEAAVSAALKAIRKTDPT